MQPWVDRTRLARNNREKSRENQDNEKVNSCSHLCSKKPVSVILINCEWKEIKGTRCDNCIYSCFPLSRKSTEGCTLSSPSRDATWKDNFRVTGRDFWHLIDSLTALYLIRLSHLQFPHFSLFPNAAIFCFSLTPWFPPLSWKILKDKHVFY